LHALVQLLAFTIETVATDSAVNLFTMLLVKVAAKAAKVIIGFTNV